MNFVMVPLPVWQFSSTDSAEYHPNHVGGISSWPKYGLIAYQIKLE
jgi:hypothetical protein